jgi:hypothetical protein
MALQIFALWFMLDVALVLAWSTWRENVGTNE